MKKIFNFFAIVLMVFAFASCNGCKSGQDVIPQDQDVIVAGYDYDSVVVGDYDYIASQYKRFLFYEVDVVFDTLLNAGTDVNIVSIGTVFQVGDTCVMIFHNPGKCGEKPEIIKECDHWMECSDMTARNPIMYDSCMALAKPYMCNMPTRKLTFRKRVGPPFPKHGEYIFGNGYLFIESHTGEITGTAVPCNK